MNGRRSDLHAARATNRQLALFEERRTGVGKKEINSWLVATDQLPSTVLADNFPPKFGTMRGTILEEFEAAD
jgi:hypothetical protein